ncbi:MAG: LysR family transcriptional regulator [Hyphomicrobiales bacterium]|nr:MAG: LysR family transcriptional regulator [Hyphomicrobiales bacterium]
MTMRKLPDLDQITSFLAVAEELNFRKAAERLGLDQSAVSRRVKDLETRLGFQLLFRTTHAVRLTDAGRTFYEDCAKLLDRLGSSVEAARRIADGRQGTLRVAYMTFAAIDLLPRAVAAYGQLNPGVAPVLAYQNTQLQKLSLARGEIDVGLMLGPFSHTDFETLEISREGPVALVAEASPLAAHGTLTVADIAQAPLVMGNDQQWDYYRRLVEDMLAAHGHRPAYAFEASSLTGILGLVRHGLGITIVPEVMGRFRPQGLVACPIRDADCSILTVAAWRRPASRMVNDFVKVLRQIAKGAGGQGQSVPVTP